MLQRKPEYLHFILFYSRYGVFDCEVMSQPVKHLNGESGNREYQDVGEMVDGRILLDSSGIPIERNQ
jgi:hypothetical protein